MRPKLYCLSLLIFISTLCTAQATNNAAIKFTPNFCAIIVRNIDSSVSWYQRVLQVKINRRMEFEGIKFAILEANDKKWMIELLQFPSMISQNEIKKGKPDTQLVGFFKFGFSINNFDALLKFLESHNATFTVRPMKDQATGKRNFVIADIDGNELQFFEE